MGIDATAITERCRRISEIEERLKLLAAMDENTFLENPETIAAAERYLQVVSQAIADIANHLIARNNWGTPGSYRDSMQLLEKNDVITQELASNLEDLMGLRNILVHDYLATDPVVLLDDLRNGLSDISEFVKEILRYLNATAAQKG